jgi:hypothetical protein
MGRSSVILGGHQYKRAVMGSCGTTSNNACTLSILGGTDEGVQPSTIIFGSCSGKILQDASTTTTDTLICRLTISFTQIPNGSQYTAYLSTSDEPNSDNSIATFVITCPTSKTSPIYSGTIGYETTITTTEQLNSNKINIGFPSPDNIIVQSGTLEIKNN